MKNKKIKSKGLKQTKIQRMLRQILVNQRNIMIWISSNETAYYKGYFAGQSLFWNNQGLTKAEKGKFNPFYEAFVKINLLLGSEAKQKNKVKILINFPAISKVDIADKELLVHFEGIELDVKDLQAISDNPLKFKQLLQELKEGK
jgi:hypothetical protein